MLRMHPSTGNPAAVSMRRDEPVLKPTNAIEFEDHCQQLEAARGDEILCPMILIALEITLYHIASALEDYLKYPRLLQNGIAESNVKVARRSQFLCRGPEEGNRDNQRALALDRKASDMTNNGEWQFAQCKLHPQIHLTQDGLSKNGYGQFFSF